MFLFCVLILQEITNFVVFGYLEDKIPLNPKKKTVPYIKMIRGKNCCVEIVFFSTYFKLKSYKQEILTELRTLTTKIFWLVLLSGF